MYQNKATPADDDLWPLVKWAKWEDMQLISRCVEVGGSAEPPQDTLGDHRAWFWQRVIGGTSLRRPVGQGQCEGAGFDQRR